jgi:cobalt-zinc-cadmium efflux system protein
MGDHHDHGTHSHGAHDHGAHDHGAHSFDRAFAFGLALNLALVVVQLVFGLLSQSMALVADAGHNFSDVLGMALAWGASALGRRRPTARRTYGFGRSSILAALANAVLVILAVGAITWESIRRLQHPTAVDGPTMMWVAALGVVVNLGSALPFLTRRRKRDLNVRAVLMHLLSDAAVSVGVVAGGLVVMLTGARWVDPVASLLIAVVIVASTWRVLRESLDLMIDAVPKQIDLEEVHEALSKLPGVIEVHDLHVWATSTTGTALSTHLVIPGQHDDGFLIAANKELHARFGIDHAVIQVERTSLAGCCELPIPGLRPASRPSPA